MDCQIASKWRFSIMDSILHRRQLPMRQQYKGIEINNSGTRSGQVNAIEQTSTSCVACEESHSVKECPRNPQSIYFVKNNPFSNTYNPGWRIHHNFAWKNNQQQDSQPMAQRETPPGFFQRTNGQQQQQASSSQTPPSSSLENLLKEYKERTLPRNHPKKWKGDVEVRKEPSKTDSKEQPMIESKNRLSQTESKESKTMEPEDAITSKTPNHGIVKVQLPPFPRRLKKKQKDEVQYHRFLEILKQIHINIPFIEAIEQMPVYAKFFKDIVSKKRSTGKFATVALTKESNTIIPPKMFDPGSFTIPCSIGGQLTPTTVTFQLADRTLVHPKEN
ncbi:uncharacterized protein LOC120079130 [Benincasa hispida]|uniref:uncharacterized protein LOC120079130 n=1 Tax=Benincasa hispida TaxID=102211 RepID=UPI0019000D82|nr:uncharacterized protein LOC120079130 [Benincasa hispida]